MRHSPDSADGPADNTGGTDIITLLHSGNKKGLAYVFNQHHIALFYLAMQFTGNALLSQDMVEECFIQLWQKRNDFQDVTAIKPFLYTKITELCTHGGRPGSRMSQQDEAGIAGMPGEAAETVLSERILIKAELLQKIWQDIEQLPPLRRKIVKMTCFEGLNVFEIAKILHVSVDTVRVQKAKAVHMIRVLAKDGI